jgi:hypothetical protein
VLTVINRSNTTGKNLHKIVIDGRMQSSGSEPYTGCSAPKEEEE